MMNTLMLESLDDNLPIDLKAQCRWVGSRGKSRHINLATGGRAKSNDPSSWSCIHDARNALADGRYGIDGIDFVAGNSFVVLDLDECFVTRDLISQSARSIVRTMSSYTELSRSLKGLHIVVRATYEGHNRKFSTIADIGAVEVFSNNHFVNLTGAALHGKHTIRERTRELLCLLDEATARIAQQHDKPPTSRPSLDDNTILRRLFNRDKFTRLWEGFTDDYPSPSEADAALASMIAYYTGDPDQITRLMLRSNLNREKWSRPRYLDQTIANAIKFVGSRVHRG